MVDEFKKDFSSLKNKKLWLFDMDGTIYLGNTIFDGTIPLLNNIKKTGAKYIFVSNNSSKGISSYLNKVTKMGIEADKNNFYTSTDALIAILKDNFYGELIYVQGTKSFIKNLKKEKIKVTTRYNENAKCICVGFDTELTMKKLITTCKMLKLDLPFYATNPDWVCPTEDGFIPDCGSMCFSLDKATGKKPVFIGKPNAFMIEEVIKKENVSKEDVVLVGDRIYTDILSGINAKIDTVLVLSGETTLKEATKSVDKPTYTIKNVKEINEIF